METCKYCEQRADHRATCPNPPYGSGETIYACSDHIHQLTQELISLGQLDPINPLTKVEQIWHPPPPQPEIAPLAGEAAYALRQELAEATSKLQDSRILRGELDAANHTIKDLRAQLTLKDSVIEDLANERDTYRLELETKKAPTIPPSA